MSDKVEVKVIELKADELKPNSKYLFLLDSSHGDFADGIELELERLIGDKFSLIILDGLDNLRIYSIPEETA